MNKKNTLLLLTVLISLIIFTAISCKVDTDLQKTNETRFSDTIEYQLDEALTNVMSENMIPGAVVGVWFPGKGTWITSKGVSNIETNLPMQTDFHFRIGSITKTFTGTAILILLDENKLKLDDPVNKYLPDIDIPNGDKITIRMLGNMTSGLNSYTLNEEWGKSYFENTEKIFEPETLAEIGCRMPVLFEPGESWFYCNTNTVLLGLVIEKVTGEKIADVFRKKIFIPLGLKNTIWPNTCFLPEPYAHGYTVQTLDNKRADATYMNPSWGYTAGQLISNLEDLHIYSKALATGTLLSEKLQNERLKWEIVPPESESKKYGFAIGSFQGWLGHSGELPGYNVCMFYFPPEDATIITMVNSDIPTGKTNPAPAIFNALTKILTPDNVPY